MNVSPQIGWVGWAAWVVEWRDIAPSRLSAAAAHGLAEAPTLSELVLKAMQYSP